MSQIELSKIKIGRRFRKDLGDIETLAESMDGVGQLEPIVLSKSNELIAGKRRIYAAKKLGWKKIKFVTVDLTNLILGEFHENTARKQFTVSEIAAIKKIIEKTRISHRPSKFEVEQYYSPMGSAEIRKMAKKRGNLPQFGPGRTREILSQYTGLGERTIDKISEITNAAEKKPRKYGHLLQRVDSGKLSISSAHKLITAQQRNLPKIPLPVGEFDVLYVDPPLRFENQNIRGSADRHYDTMQLEEICKLKIPAAENAVLFLWMPSSMFFDVQDYKIGWDSYRNSTLGAILHHWKFEAKTFFVWKKDKIGLGSYNRNQHENLILAFKGTMPTPAKLFSSIIEAPREEHSKKPEIVYEMIEQMYPKRKYLELFARRKHSDKWTVWGNQLEAATA